MTEPLLEAKGLHAGYVRDADILNGVDIHISEGELMTIVGPNGAGKSTLVKAIMGLVPYRSGNIVFQGEEISRERPHTIARRGIGYVPQRANVFPSMTVRENLEFGLIPNPDVDAAARRDLVHELFPLLTSRRRQLAGTLSGGERQMVAMGRVLMADPRLLLLDEPSGGLAPVLVEIVFEKIGEISATGIAVLLVEQNARRALAISHRGYVLDLGRNCFEGAGPALLNDPKVAELYLGGAPVEALTKEGAR